MNHLNSKEIKAEFETLFNIIYQGNKEAGELSMMLVDMAATLDTLIDRDRPVTDQSINAFAHNAMFGMHRFSLFHQAGLSHHLLSCYLKWLAANSLETDKGRSKDDLSKAYMLRAGIYDIFGVIAYYLHGFDWAQKIYPILYRSYGESLESYIDEIGYAESSSGLCGDGGG